MQKKRLVAAVGTMALMANALFPSLAFGQDDQQTADVTLNCGALTLTVDVNNNFRMALAGGTTPTVDTSAQAVFGKLTGNAFGVDYQNDTDILPNEAFIAVNDTRTVGSGTGCAANATDEGWLLQLSSSDFSDGATATIDASNFYVVTTTNITPDANLTEEAGTGDGSDTNVFYTTGFGGTKNVVAQYNVADTADLTAAATFTGQAASLDSSRDILDNATGVGVNDFKFVTVGTGLAYHLNIPANQPGGTYTATVDIDLITGT